MKIFAIKLLGTISFSYAHDHVNQSYHSHPQFFSHSADYGDIIQSLLGGQSVTVYQYTDIPLYPKTPAEIILIGISGKIALVILIL
jgi:hypothetical protein